MTPSNPLKSVPSDASSSQTLAAPLSTSPPAVERPSLGPEPEKPRSYLTALDDPDREAEEAEREFADYGGDVPTDRVLVRRTTLKRAASRARSRSGTTSSFPDLHLTDSAFDAAHREMSRVYSRVITATGETVEVAEPVQDPNKVQWNHVDPDNPQQWPTSTKWAITALCSLLTVNVTFASSAPSSATQAIATEFNKSTELATLTTSLFLCGYCLGPLLWAPISELVGRRPVFLATMLIYSLFQLPSALAPNIESVLVGRFLAGTFAAAPLTNCGGVIADIWDPIGRGPAMSVFSASVFIGPVMGPIVGGFTTSSFLGWRWVFWFMMIFSGTCWVLVTILLPETYSPVLLAQRAKAMRKADPEKNKDVYAELERADFSLKSVLTRTLARPFRMLAVEPILLLVTLYLSVIYGLLYALFSVFPIVWGEIRGFNNGETGLMFIGVGIGTTMGAIINIMVQRHYKVLVPKWHNCPPPEERLWGAMLAGPFLLIGIFMLGWTGNYPSIHWIVPEIAAVFLGMSFTLVFISFLSYLIETYLMFSASALAANTICRSAVGAAFPLFTDQMFKRLGVGWACSLIGLIGIIIFPSPYLFYKYGPRIREGSTFAPCLDIHMRERVEKEEREEEEEKERIDV